MSSADKLGGNKSVPTSYQNWSKFDQKRFLREFGDINWMDALNLDEGDVDSSFDSFNSIMSGLVDRHLPTVKLTQRQTKVRFQKPWITTGILKSITKRDFFFRKFTRSNSPDAKSFFHNQFKRYRNMIVSLCRRSKINHFSRYFNVNSNNVKKIWQGVRDIISLKSSKSLKPISLKINGAVVSDPTAVANSFNSYFSSIAESIRSQVPPSSKQYSFYLNHSNRNSMFLSPVTPEEVSNSILSLSSNKSSGPNSIPIKILKLIHQDISFPLSNIINLSFTKGRFPSTLKLSKVIPVFKKGSPLESSNYRPISLLSNIEKIFEKLMHSRLLSFLDSHSIIYCRQYGFRKSHSTIQALINIVERIRQCIDKGHAAVGVFVDLTKAFDTVDHSILLSKLSHYGVRGITNCWFKSYLASRSQFVSISNCKSELKTILHGVPQGSVLGPLLFLLYINDLHEAIKFSEVNLFADDTTLFQFGASLKSLSDNVNTDLSLLSDWLNANKIALNASKTEYVLFKSRLKTFESELEIYITGRKLDPSTSIKYLGVKIDQHLKWGDHISDISVKLRRANGAISRLRHFLPRSILINIYHAIFNSHLSYACQLWGQYDSKFSHRVLVLQKYALRLISFSNPRSPSSPLFARLKILQIFDLVKVLNVLFVYQFLNAKLPTDLRNTFSFTKIDHFYSTRSKALGILKIPKVNTKLHAVSGTFFSNSFLQYNYQILPKAN
jgi:hypothetical protein